ncbi:helix-turn-helix domain-containing protein [Microlunatus antarcticus]|jgi:transcriptional regulator with XRE-family HTH domain|uniref:Transcriptional regulator with XRE-family HTH domain n=1 Tax=Microlunatus antarcticus TaxID=53388 RepID=A0A7W5JVK9_9ACTN|nr:helix-turn-helix transcriptional regulator [Microlunatus antarcticus]MBB3327025.1 transcriptional regulator with XRE-family HTH domain [Microlunatus antarcticus]
MPSKYSHAARDTALVVQGLQAALHDSGLSQAGFARALETSASRFSTYLSGSTSPSAAFFVRAQRLANGLKVSGQLGRTTPSSIGIVVREALEEGDEVWAFKMLLRGRDDLRAMLNDETAGADAWECDPGPLDAPAWDALLCAVIAHEFDEADRVAPRWTRRGVDTGPWTFANPYFDADEVRRRTPPWLAERGVLVAGRDLVTA